MKKKRLFLVVMFSLFFSIGIIAQAQTAPTAPPVQIGQWYAAEDYTLCGIPSLSWLCPTNWRQIQSFGIGINVLVGDPAAKTLSTTLLYAYSNGRLRVQTQQTILYPSPTLNPIIFVTGKNVTPTEIIATTNVVGEMMAGASDTIYYAGTNTPMASSAVQNAPGVGTGTGVMITTTFQANDTDSTGVLAVLNYGGTSETRIASRQHTTWLPTTKPVQKVDL